MAIKKTGISRDLIIHPGETIADILEVREMTRAELAARTGVSPAFVGSVIAGKKGISGNFAMALEYALDIPKSFWLNLQARYDAEILEADEMSTVTEDELAIRRELNEIVRYLRNQHMIPEKEKLNESVLSLRKLFKVSSLCNLERISAASAFRMSRKDKVTPCVLGAWIRMCSIHECRLEKAFDRNSIDLLVEELKDVMLSDTDDIQEMIKTVLYRYGLDFEIVRHFTGAPVQGFLFKRTDGGIKICMTIRRAFADIFWFSLFHELGHLYNGDLSRTAQFLDNGKDKEKEDAADRFAADRLIDREAYKRFIDEYREVPCLETIERFAAKQRVRPFIIIGRMQKEKILGYDQYANEKKRYKWAEEE